MALETLKGILSNDKKLLAPQILRIPYKSAEKHKKTRPEKSLRTFSFTPANSQIAVLI